ncbi:MAG TPA: FAD-dependent oxidoreductase [Candidatus Limnocylindria bacterium]|nr:FAD-dependent oxidoreductase [Candidatus Limnocylindria bacterium]
MNSTNPERHDAIVIGAGQAGLAAAYHLARRGIDFVVLERDHRVGDQWRSRYDSLRLYSPAKYDGLPGTPLPMPGHTFPSGNEMAAYLESYAAQFGDRVRTGVSVDRLRRAADGGYEVVAGDATYQSPNVIVAAGFFRDPYTPAFASSLHSAIRQMHSNDYRRPSQLADGPVLIVGFSHSGADLAMESVANGHPTILSGKPHGQLPFSVDSRRGRVAWPLLKFIGSNVLTIRTPVGRKMRPEIRHNGGAPLLRYRRDDLLKAGVELVESRVAGVHDGKPLMADGRVLDVANVIWCTGFRPDFGWIDLPIFGDDGFPNEERGVVAGMPGIGFVGLPFQFGFTSMLVVGAGPDARHVVDRLTSGSRGRELGELPPGRRVGEAAPAERN